MNVQESFLAYKLVLGETIHKSETQNTEKGSCKLPCCQSKRHNFQSIICMDVERVFLCLQTGSGKENIKSGSQQPESGFSKLMCCQTVEDT